MLGKLYTLFHIAWNWTKVVHVNWDDWKPYSSDRIHTWWLHLSYHSDPSQLNNIILPLFLMLLKNKTIYFMDSFNWDPDKLLLQNIMMHRYVIFYCYRNHLNDMENIPVFLFLGLLYVATNPTPSVALWHFRIFTHCTHLAHILLPVCHTTNQGHSVWCRPCHLCINGLSVLLNITQF